MPHIPRWTHPCFPRNAFPVSPFAPFSNAESRLGRDSGGQLLRPSAHGEGLRKGRNHTNRPQSEASLQRMNLTLAGEVGRPER